MCVCPEFFLAPDDIVKRAGAMTQMSCQYDAEGTAVTWDKDMTFVTPGTSCDCQFVGNGLLRFNNLTAMDSGTYTCNANVENFPACSATLRLAGALVFLCMYVCVCVCVFVCFCECVCMYKSGEKGVG